MTQRNADDGITPAPAGKVWQCQACGKKARTRYGFDNEGKGTALSSGYDESCMLNAVLVEEEAEAAS